MRNARQLTQGGLADALGVSQPKYNKWENDINRPDYETVVRLARFYGTTTDYLLGANEEPAPEQSVALTGLAPEAIERIRAVWQGNHEPGYIPPVIRALNDLILQKNFSALACIASFLYFDDSSLPDTVSVEYEGKTIKIPLRREDVFRHGLFDALKDMLPASHQ